MSGIRQILIGLVVVALAGLIIFGAFTISNKERRQTPAQPVDQTQETAPAGSPTPTLKPTATSSATPIPSDMAPFTETVAVPTETEQAGVGGEEDLTYRSLLPGAFVQESHVSSVIIIQDQATEASPSATEASPTATEQAESVETQACSRPRGWSNYTVRRGDTLARLSKRVGVSVARIKKANCMGTSNKLKVGKSIFLPKVKYAPYILPPMRYPVPPQPWYYRPPQDSQSIQPTQPVIIVTPMSPSAAVPDATEKLSIDRAYIGILVYNAIRF